MSDVNELMNISLDDDNFEYVCSLYLNNINKVIYLFSNSRNKGSIFIEPFSNIKFVFNSFSGSRWTKETLTYLGDYGNNAEFYCTCKKFKDSNNKKFIKEVKDYFKEDNAELANFIYDEIEKYTKYQNNEKCYSLLK